MSRGRRCRSGGGAARSHVGLWAPPGVGVAPTEVGAAGCVAVSGSSRWSGKQ
jgi:hypothetical protein